MFGARKRKFPNPPLSLAFKAFLCLELRRKVFVTQRDPTCEDVVGLLEALLEVGWPQGMSQRFGLNKCQASELVRIMRGEEVLDKDLLDRLLSSYWEENGRSPADEDGEYTYNDGFDEEDNDKENDDDDDASGTDSSEGNVGDK